ncbi:unnamed protein product [Meloidogyne enterolobii]|uniref:Uncharacterized protein n=1 Tax=Meloidogyne enterolobii TaxID=390850 RepID=A0ACB0YPM4_MELEN
MKNAPKTVLNHVRYVGGGAGFSIPSSGTAAKPQGGNTGGIGLGKFGGGNKVGLGALQERNRLFGEGGEEETGGGGEVRGRMGSTISGETQLIKSHVPSYNPQSPSNLGNNNFITTTSHNTQNKAGPYDDETNSFRSSKLKDQVVIGNNFFIQFLNAKKIQIFLKNPETFLNYLKKQIPQHHDDIPPAIKGHFKQHQTLSNKPSHMNLFSDLAETKFGSERLGEEGGGTNKLSRPLHPTLLRNKFPNNQHKHSFPHSLPHVGHSLVPVAAAQSIIVVNKKSGLPDRSTAKCGRKCNPEQLPPSEAQRLARMRHLRTRSQPYLYAYMNPPANEVAKANAKIKRRDSRSTKPSRHQINIKKLTKENEIGEGYDTLKLKRSNAMSLQKRTRASPIRRVLGKKQRMVPLHSGGYDGDVPKVRIRVDDNTSVGKNHKKNIRLTNKERMRKYVKKKKMLNYTSFY